MKKLAFLALLLAAFSVEAQTFPVGTLRVQSTVNATSPSTGAATVAGGLGVAQDVYSGAAFHGSAALSGGSISGAAVSGGSLAGSTITSSPISGSTGSFSSLSATAGSLTGVSVAGSTGSFTTLSGTSLSVTNSNPSVNFLSSGTGAVARIFTSKMGDIVSVRDFGADNTGIVNATSAIQAAMAYACTFSGSQGATVFIPSGVYLVSAGSFTAGCNGLNIVGAGVTNTTLNVSATGTNADLFDFNTVTGTGIYSLYINYLGSPTSGITIESNSAYNFTVQDVRINGAFEAIGVLGLGVPQFYSNIDIEGTQTNGVGVYINGGSDQYFNNVLIYSPSTTPAACMHIQNSGGVFVNGLDAVHCQTGLLIDPPNGSSVDWLSFTNADFDSNTQHGIYFTPATGGSVYGSNFVNTWSSSNGDIGVYISATGGTVSGVRFVGHRGLNNGQDGIVLNPTSGTVTNIQISDSDFSGNSQSSSGTYNGITVGAGVSGFMITGCLSGVYANYANTQRYGILVNSGASNNYIITNNRAQNNVTGDVQDNGSGATKVVTNNL